LLELAISNSARVTKVSIGLESRGYRVLGERKY